MRSKSLGVLLLGGILWSSCGKDNKSTPSAEVQTLVDQSIAWMNEDLDSSLYYAQSALDASRRSGDHTGENHALVLPTMIFVNRDEAGVEGDSVAKNLLRVSEDADNTYGIARAKSALGILSFRRGDIKNAVPLLEDAAELAQARPTLMNDLINLGAAYGYCGFLRKELKCYVRALEICDTLGNTTYRRKILANTASSLNDLGYTQQAKQLFHNCISEKFDHDPITLADAYTGLSAVCRSLSEYDSAYLYLRLSDSLWIAEGQLPGSYRNRVEAAKIDFELNRYQIALDSLGKIDTWASAGLDSLVYYEMIQLRGLAYLGTGAVDSSFKYLELYAAFATRTGNLNLIGEHYRTACDAFTRLGYMDDSEVYCRLASEIRDSAERHYENQREPGGKHFYLNGKPNDIRKTTGSNIGAKAIVITIVLVVLVVVVVFYRRGMRTARNRFLTPSGDETQEIGKAATLTPPTTTANVAKDELPLAIERPPVPFQNVVCAKSQGHFFLLIYLDGQGKVQTKEVDTRTPKKLPLSVFQENSGGRLLESKRGCLVNPAFCRLSEDKSKIYLVPSDAATLIEANVERKRKTGDGYFDEYPLPIATTPGKNFVDRLAAWQIDFGAE